MAKEEYLTQLYKDLDYSSVEFDKSLTYVSSGVLAISYAFIDKIVNLEKSIFNEYLITGWVIISISIFIALLAHYISILFQKAAIKHYKRQDDSKQEKIRKWSWRVIGGMNLLNIALILIGTLYIFYFININLNSQ